MTDYTVTVTHSICLTQP